MARDTRQRILDAALGLFNAHGEPHVTTNHIADELGISPGNLYYHFRNKDHIIEQLFDRYEAQLDTALAVPVERLPNLEDIWLQLHLVFECIRAYRFLYRDLVEILSRNRRIRLRFGRILRRTTDSAREVMDGLGRSGAMQASPAEMDATATNLVVIATFWMNYAAARGDPHGEAVIGDGIVQVMRLLAPYLAPGERQHLEALALAYRS